MTVDQRRIKAAEQGESIYLGSACRKCGNERRYTLTGQCVHCVNERSKANAKKRTERVRALLEQAKAGA